MDSLHSGRSFCMEDQKMKLGPEQSVQMPMKTVISLIVMVALGTFGFFQIQEKLNQNSTKIEIMERDLTLNTEFRIKWPRGLLGSLPADSEQKEKDGVCCQHHEAQVSAEQQTYEHRIETEPQLRSNHE